MMDDFLDDESEEFLGELGIEIRLFRKPFQAVDLIHLARLVGGREAVFGFEPAHGLGVLEAFGERIDEDRVQPVNTGAVAGQKLGGAGDGVCQWRASGAGWR